LPIFLYKYTKDSEEKWVIYRKIANPNNQICFTLNFCYNEVIKKTLFYFPFDSSTIGIYDLKADKLEKTELQIKRGVTSMNFLFREKQSTSNLLNVFHLEEEGFLIYSQWTSTLIIANIETNKIVRKTTLNNVAYIYDCVIWNSFPNNLEQIYLIVATQYSDSIQILNFDDLSILFIKKLEKRPINLLKVLKKKAGEKDKECLSCFIETGDDNKIIIYEKK